MQRFPSLFRLAPPIWLAALALSGPARAEVVWTGDFETGDFSQWQGANEDDIEIVTDVVFQGTYAARFEIHDGESAVFNDSQLRVQVTHNDARTAEGDDMYMAKYIYMPEDAKVRNQIQYWESGQFSNNIDFWVTPKDGGGTTLHFGTGLLGENEVWSTDLAIGQWHLVIHHVHWSENEQEGAISVWYDGELVVDAINLATKPDGTALFTQLGFHRTPHDPAVDVIYIDGVIEADSLDDVMALPVPNAIGMGGMGGAAGMGGTAGVAGEAAGGMAGAPVDPNPGGAGAGGASGAAAGSAGMPPVAMAGSAGAAGSAGMTAAAGAPVVAGSGGATTTPMSTSNGSGCSLAPRSSFSVSALGVLCAFFALSGLRRRS